MNTVFGQHTGPSDDGHPRNTVIALENAILMRSEQVIMLERRAVIHTMRLNTLKQLSNRYKMYLDTTKLGMQRDERIDRKTFIQDIQVFLKRRFFRTDEKSLLFEGKYDLYDLWARTCGIKVELFGDVSSESDR